MGVVRDWLKRSLPPKLGYRLRVLKALMVDGELRTFAKVARAYGADDAVALDVGANVGIYAAILSRRFGQVICFEPNPVCREYLRKVLPANCLLLETALSDQEGVAELRVPIFNDRSETTLGTISAANAFDGPTQTFPVRIRPLDAVIREIEPQLIGRITLLKLDVEGHELSVLRGARSLLSGERPAVVAELEARHGTPVQEVLTLLEGLCYEKRLFDVAGRAVPGRDDGKGRYQSPNYIFAPAARAEHAHVAE